MKRKLVLVLCGLVFCVGLVACKKEEVPVEPVPVETSTETAVEEEFSPETLPEVVLEPKETVIEDNDVTGSYDSTETSVVGSGAATNKESSITEVVGSDSTNVEVEVAE